MIPQSVKGRIVIWSNFHFFHRSGLGADGFDHAAEAEVFGGAKVAVAGFVDEVEGGFDISRAFSSFQARRRKSIFFVGASHRWRRSVKMRPKEILNGKKFRMAQ